MSQQGGGPPHGWGPPGQPPQQPWQPQQQPQQQQQWQQPQQQPQQQQWQQPLAQQPGQAPAQGWGQQPAGQPSPIKMAGNGCILLVALAVTFIVLFTGVGDSLNDWQADVLGGWYYPKLTFLLVFMVVLLPPMAIFNLVLKAMGKDKAR